MYVEVAQWSGLIRAKFQLFVAVVSFPGYTNQTGGETIVAGAEDKDTTMSAGHAHSTGIVPRRWERGVSVLWTPLV